MGKLTLLTTLIVTLTSAALGQVEPPAASKVEPTGDASVEAVPLQTTEVVGHPDAAVATTPTASQKPGWIYPATQSEFANYIDQINNFINIVSVICFVGIIAFMVYFAVRFRRRDPHQKALSQASHNNTLELAWTIPPTIICFVMFWLGFDGFLKLSTPPDNAYQVTATGSMWAWTFTHPNARVDAAETVDYVDEQGQKRTMIIPAILHVPADEPVAIQIQSRDTLHSLSIPAFRVKKDAVPGRYTYLWFSALDPTPGHYDQHADIIDPKDPQKQDKFRKKLLKLKSAADNGHIIYCTEFCGKDHSNMWGRVVVHPKGWRPAALDISALPPADQGKVRFAQNGCASCHQLQPGGPKLTGPTFAQGIFGKKETLTTGEQIDVTDEYLFESIRNPSAKIVAGHAAGQMPPQPQLTDEHVRHLVEYIKTIGKEPAAQ